MNKPITDARLGALREMVAADLAGDDDGWASAPGHVGELIAEVDRLRAALARVTDDSMALKIDSEVIADHRAGKHHGQSIGQTIRDAVRAVAAGGESL